MPKAARRAMASPGRSARVRPTRALTLILALTFVDGALPTQPGDSGSQPIDHCTALQEKPSARRAIEVGTSKNVTLVYGPPVALAAAALLRAALLAAGHSAAMQHRPDDTVCSLLNYTTHTKLGPVHVATAWEKEKYCSLGTAALRVQGAGAAPLQARLLSRLASTAPLACRYSRHISFYSDEAALRRCGFLHSAADGTNETDVTIYVLRGEWKSAEEELGVQLARSRDGLRLQIASAPLSRVELARRVLDSLNTSVLFLDAAELWEDVPAVQPVAGTNMAAPLSLLVIDEYKMLVYAPSLHALFIRLQPPPPSALRALLEAAHTFNSSDVAQAACELLGSSLNQHMSRYNRVFADWVDTAHRPVPHKAIVIFCKEGGSDYSEYKQMAKSATGRIFNSTISLDLGIGIRFDYISCEDPKQLASDALKVLNVHEEYWPSRLAGAVLPSEAVIAVMNYGKDSKLPLLAYDVGADAVSTSGRVAHLALALRRLLAEFGWQRVVLLSEPTERAKPLSKALQGPLNDLLKQQGPIDDKLRVCPRELLAGLELEPMLRQISDAGNKVFVVNGGAAMAGRVLAAGHALNLTRAAGFAWVVLEYSAPDAATAALQPYSVSFQWRGNPPADAAGTERREGEAALYATLDAQWRARAWPLHASSIVNAILTLGEGFKSLVRDHPEMRDDPGEMDKARYFWNSTRNKKISGIVENLTYYEDGLASPLVYVEQWSNTPWPRRLATWRAGLWASGKLRLAANETIVKDREPCLVRADSDCQVHCSTVSVLWGTAAGALLLSVVALTARAARLAFIKHIERKRTEYLARLLASRERNFGKLAQHMCDRTALDRREELGAGHYGRVWRGFLNAPRGTRRLVAVAIKELKDGASPNDENQFLHEACTLSSLEHEHVVRFVGVCLLDGPPLLLMEFALFGDLLQYLRARRHLASGGAASGETAVGHEESAYVSPEALTRFAREAAEALAYLASRGIVHRDVRASNCVVDERRALKLADFGMARATHDPDSEYVMGGTRMVPVLYWPRESVALGVSSVASDVWSLGVLVLELVTLGERPWGALPLDSVVRRVRLGRHPPLPADASADTRRLAAACWRVDAARRPPACKLAAWLARRPRALHPAFDDAGADADFDADSGFGESKPDRLHDDLDD